MIYTPTGAAREYSPWALNIYKGCRHACLYCFAPGMLKQTVAEYSSHETPKENARARIAGALAGHARSDKAGEAIFLSFIGDPYCMAEQTEKITRFTLETGLNKTPIIILTKAGRAACRDIDIFKQYGQHISIGQSLTFLTDDSSSKWEPGAASPQDRLDALKKIHAAGIPTWASMEPVIDTQESSLLLFEALEFVDYFKIGKINHAPDIEHTQNWESFLLSTIQLLRKAKKRFYIKQSLRAAAPRAAKELRPEETEPDIFNPEPWARGGFYKKPEVTTC